MFRKISPLLVVLISIFLLAGCSSQTSGLRSDGEVVVEIFNQKPEISAQLETLEEALEKENPNTDIVITTIGSGEGAADLQAKFTSGNPPAILTVDYSTSVEELFVNDRVAMIHQGIWVVPTLNEIDPDFVQEKLGILPVFGEDDETGRIVAVAPCYWGINKDMPKEVIEVAKDFLDYISDLWDTDASTLPDSYDTFSNYFWADQALK